MIKSLQTVTELPLIGHLMIIFKSNKELRLMIRHLIPNLHQDNANNNQHQTSQFITEINI
jgi:hypothetical protein